jgi:hypothetical protein
MARLEERYRQRARRLQMVAATKRSMLYCSALNVRAVAALLAACGGSRRIVDAARSEGNQAASLHV